MRNLPIGVTVGGIVLVELGFCVAAWQLGSGAFEQTASPTPYGVTNTAALGRVLYTQYAYLFEASGLVLLTAMVGAIVLTLHHKPGVKRQNVAEQNARTAATAVEMKKQPSRAGV
jgi:NADH-quinone oxidoreductase subunit J